MLRLSLLLLFVMAGCTYGPVQERARVWTAEERFNTHTFAVSVDWERYRDPTGISQFPDGGAPRMLRQEALFYVCDADSHTARLLARIPRTKEVESGFEGWILGWDDDGLYVSVSGRRYSPAHGGFGPISRRTYRLGLDGTCVRVDDVPTSIHREPETGISLPGETKFLRVNTSWNAIDLRLAEGGGYVRWFLVHPDGTIAPVGSM